VLHIALIVGGVWSALALVTYVAVLPVLRAASNSDRWLSPPGREPAPPRIPLSVGYREPAPVPGAPQRIELAYAALALDRLVIQTATLLGAEQACMLVKGKGSLANVVVVAQHGLDQDALGEGLPDGHELALKALVEGHFLKGENGAIGTIDPAKAEAIGTFLFDHGILLDANGAALEEKPDFSAYYTNDLLG